MAIALTIFVVLFIAFVSLRARGSRGSGTESESGSNSGWAGFWQSSDPGDANSSHHHSPTDGSSHPHHDSGSSHHGGFDGGGHSGGGFDGGGGHH